MMPSVVLARAVPRAGTHLAMASRCQRKAAAVAVVAAAVVLLLRVVLVLVLRVSLLLYRLLKIKGQIRRPHLHLAAVVAISGVEHQLLLEDLAGGVVVERCLVQVLKTCRSVLQVARKFLLLLEGKSQKGAGEGRSRRCKCSACLPSHPPPLYNKKHAHFYFYVKFTFKIKTKTKPPHGVMQQSQPEEPCR